MVFGAETGSKPSLLPKLSDSHPAPTTVVRRFGPLLQASNHRVTRLEEVVESNRTFQSPTRALLQSTE